MEDKKYIGARYVPLVLGPWQNGMIYEALSVVTYNGKVYTSKTKVPAGILPTNESYWVFTIDSQNEDVNNLKTRMNTAEGDIDSLEGRMNTAEGDIDSLEGRMNTAEGDIDSLEGRMNTAEGNITISLARTKTSYKDLSGDYSLKLEIADNNSCMGCIYFTAYASPGNPTMSMDLYPFFVRGGNIFIGNDVRTNSNSQSITQRSITTESGKHYLNLTLGVTNRLIRCFSAKI